MFSNKFTQINVLLWKSFQSADKSFSFLYILSYEAIVNYCDKWCCISSFICDWNKLRIPKVTTGGVLFKKAVLKTFANFTGKHLCWSLILIDLQHYEKDTPMQVFSSDFCEIFNKTYFEELLQTTASGILFTSFTRFINVCYRFKPNCATANYINYFAHYQSLFYAVITDTWPCGMELFINSREDDCHCEKCENNKLLLWLLSRKNWLLIKCNILVKIDPASFRESLICCIKNYDCCRGNRKTYVLEEYQELSDYVKTLKEIQYFKWVCEENKCAKVNIIATGLEIADVFIEIYEVEILKKMKWFSVSILVTTAKINKRMKFRVHTLTMRLLHYTMLRVTLKRNLLVQNVILIIIYISYLWW